jgi:amino acid transporter
MFSFSSAKPSSIKDGRVEGDIQNFLRRCKEHPIYTFSCLIILILLFLILNIFFVEFVHRLDNTPKMYKFMPIVAFVGCYVLMAQFTTNQYLINGVSICLLVVVLKVVSK